MSSLRVFVAGTWHEDRAVEWASQAWQVGELVAQAGHDLGCGPGTGISEHVIAGFRSVPDRQGLVHFVLPGLEYMKAAGEVVRYDLADRIEQTARDYPTRNVYQVSLCAGLVVVAGSGGSLQEINVALHDYHLPVGVMQGSGLAAQALELLLPLFPNWAPRVLLGSDPESITTWVLDRLQREPRSASQP